MFGVSGNGNIHKYHKEQNRWEQVNTNGTSKKTDQGKIKVRELGKINESDKRNHSDTNFYDKLMAGTGALTFR